MSNSNLSLARRPSLRDRVCIRLFAINKSLDQPYLIHKYSNLY